MARFLKIASWILLIASPLYLFGQNTDFPLEVSINIMPPYPVKLAEYTDFNSQVFINVRNTTNIDYEVSLKGTLVSADGQVRVKTRDGAIANCIARIIPANGMVQLMGTDFDGLFDAGNIDASGTTLSDIELTRALPDGDYTLCFRLFDCNTPGRALSADACQTFTPERIQPPNTIWPSCGEIIADEAYTFQWEPVLSMQSANVSYKLQFIELEPPGTDATQAFLNFTGNYIEEIDVGPATSYNFLFESNVLFESRKSYAYRVTAYDSRSPNNPEDAEIQFYNNGASVPCAFTLGNDTGEFTFEPSFPKNGDYIPYDFFPFITKFSPYNNRYIRFEGDFRLLEKQGESYRQVDRRTSSNDWGEGPARGQSSGSFIINESQAQYLPVYKNLIMSPAPSLFERGKQYAWEFYGEMDVRGGSTVSDDIDRVEFTVGMSPASHIAPANGSTQVPGLIKLKWKSAQEPSKVVPFNVSQWGRRTDGGVSSLYSNAIDEHWVLEVSNATDFDSIIYTDNNQLQFSAVGSESEAEITSALYSDLERGHDFTEEGTYYWRIKWLKTPGDLTSEAYSISPVWNFTIGEPEEGGEVTEGPCISGCDAPEITDRSATTGLAVGDKLKIGKFDLEVTTISSSSGNQFTGEGEIEISFLNFKVLVDFTNIQYNAGTHIFSGTVKAKEDRQFPYETNINQGATAIGMDESAANNLNDFISSGERLVSLFTDNRAIGLPIGIDNEVAGKQFTIAVLEMEFTPERAALQAVANIDLNLMDETHFFSAGIGDFCFSPTGFGKEGVAFLPNDHSFSLRNGAQFTMKGLGNASSLSDSASYSYFNWDCNGFKCVNLLAEYQFSRDVIVPDSEDGTPGAGNVVARMNLKSCRGANFIARLDMDAFQIPSKAMEGYAFVVDEAWLDWSSFDNPPEFLANLPENYNHPDLQASDARLKNAWNGFWLKRLHLKIPKYIGNVERERLSAGIDNMIIDNTGFTCSFSVENVVNWEQNGGNVEGFAFSLDKIYLNIVQNSFTDAGLEGKIGLPISGETEYLEYDAAITHADTATGFRFVIKPKETLSIPIYIAQAQIEPTSTFEIRLGSENYVGIELNGSLSISSDNQPGEEAGGDEALNLSMPGVSIEHLRLNSRDGFDGSDFTYSLASPQKNMSGFPISLDPEDGLSLGLDGMNPSLTITPVLTLAGENSGFSAAASIVINSELNINTDNGRKKFRLTGVDLSKIRIEVIASAITLRGELEFYKTTSAKGVRGELEVILPMGIGAQLKADFGAVKTPGATEYNTREWFSYWYVDGMIYFGTTGVDLFPPSVVLYGIGGGVYHHMSQSSLPGSESIGSGGSASSPASSGTTYLPNYDNMLGLKFTALLGSAGEGKAYNMDVTLEAEFSSYNGLTYIGFIGNVRVLSEGVPKVGEAPIMGSVRIAYHNPDDGSPTVEGDLIITVDVYGVVTGAGEIKPNTPEWYAGPTDNAFVWARFYAGDDEWYFHMGTPENRAGLAVLDFAEFNSYLMIGHRIPTELPAPSAEFLRIFDGENDRDFQAENSDKLADFQNSAGQRDAMFDASYTEGTGFAMGASFSARLDLEPWPFYFYLGMALGFDINVTKSADREVACDYAEEVGVNGWYAQGQFYAAIEGGFGIKVKLFRTRKIPIFTMAAGMVLKGNMPNPVGAKGRARIRYEVLGGLFKGNFTFDAELGEYCPVGAGGIQSITFIQDLQPSEELSDVDVYTNCTAAFTLPLEEVLEIPRNDEAFNDLPPQRVKAFIHSWELNETGGGSLATYEPVFMEDNTIAELEPKQALKQNTSHTQTLTLKAYELEYGQPDRLMNWEESRTETFTTGDAPDHFPDDQIAFSYPFKNQRFFLKGETNGNKGYVQLKQGDPNNLNTYGSEFREHDYVARFHEIGTDSYFDTPLIVTNYKSSISFDVSSLKNDTYYAVQILKIKNPPPQNEEESTTVDNTRINQIRTDMDIDVGIEQYSAAVKNREIFNTTLGTIGSDILKERRLPGPRIKSAYEHILYHYYFKTDKENNFTDKVNQAGLQSEFTKNGNFEKFETAFTGDVEFDKIDGKGFRKNGRTVFPALIDLKIVTQGGEFATYSYPVNYYYNNYYAKVQHFKSSVSSLVRVHGLPALNRYFEISFDNSTYFKSSSTFKNLIDENELNTVNNPAPENPVQIASSSSSTFDLGSSSIFGSGLFGGSSGLYSFNPPPVTVVQTLSFTGRANFASFRSALSGYMSRRFPNVIATSGSVGAEHYTRQYRSRGWVANGRRITHYLLHFHSTLYGRLWGVLFTDYDEMNYQNTTPTRKHSYIMQYQYPGPNRAAPAINGTHKRVTMSKTGN